MVVKRRFIFLLLGLCLCLNLLFPGLTLAQGYIGDDFEGIIDDVVIYAPKPGNNGTIGEGFEGLIDEVLIYIPSSGNKGYVGENFEGTIDEVVLYNEVLHGSMAVFSNPIIKLINPPAGWAVPKEENVFSFNLIVFDPDPAKLHLTTKLYFDGFQVENFTARNLETNEVLHITATGHKGELTAVNGAEYKITINNKNEILGGDPDYFELKVFAKNSARGEGQEIVTVLNYSTEIIGPSINITGLTENQKIPKHDDSFFFRITATDSFESEGSNLQVEFYLIPTHLRDEDGGEDKEIAENRRQPIKVNKFTAGGTKITDGNLRAESNKTYDIVLDKTVLPIETNKFILKAVVRDTSHAEGKREVSLIHYNNLPKVSILGLSDGQKIDKAKQTLEFTIKAEDLDPLDVNLVTEISLGVSGFYQKVTEFTVDGVKNTQGQFTALSGTEYAITLNKINYVPLNAPEFKLKVEAKDTCGEKGKEELTLIHSTDTLAQWPLDVIKDGLTPDASGNNNYGTVKGATLTTGVINNAFEFDGVDDYVEVPLSPNLTITTNSFSVEAWVRTNDAALSNKGIVTNYRHNTVPFWKLGLAGLVAEHRGKIHFELRDSAGNYQEICSPTPLNDGKWHHLVGVRNAEQGKVSFYVDGALVGEAAAPSGSVNSGQSIAFGEHSNRYFQGCIDEVTLYSRALTADEVKRNYGEVFFLDDLKMTNKFNDESSHTCTFGLHQNKLEFELKKTVEELVIELDLPSSIKVKEITGVFEKDAAGSYVAMDKSKVSATKEGKITFAKSLAKGHYKVELLLEIDENLTIKSKSFYDEKKIKTNCENEIFWFEFMDFDSLPDVQ